MGIRPTNGCEATSATLTRLFACAIAIGAALVLLGACARQGQPTALPEGMRVSAGTLVPTGVSAEESVPRPTTWAGPAGEPSAPTPAAGDLGPSGADVAVPVAAGETGIYTVTVRGPGRGLSMGIVSTGVLSSGVAPLRIEGSRPVCGLNGRDVNCNLGDLQAGDAATVTLDLSARGAGTPSTGTVGPSEAATTPTRTDLVIQAGGPTSVLAGQPVTYTYTISNRGASEATGVYFQDVIPSDMNLVGYAPGRPDCIQGGDTLTCTLRDPGGGEAITFALVITGYGEQPMIVSLDPLLPGWPICTVLKERTWLHVVQCELGDLKPGQATRVQLVLTAIGVVERTTANTAAVRADETDLNPTDNIITTTIAVQTGAAPGGD
jgi:uncharacterized repeat protein (TIGR01451 family)